MPPFPSNVTYVRNVRGFDPARFLNFQRRSIRGTDRLIKFGAGILPWPFLVPSVDRPTDPVWNSDAGRAIPDVVVVRDSCRTSDDLAEV
jgi:hypothetical protein